MIRMIAHERQEKILNYLSAKKNASVNELMDLLQTSDSTLRRDLMILEQKGLCTRVHGGVSFVESDQPIRAQESTMSRRRKVAQKEKQEIARKAIGLIHDGDLVYIDAGTTTEALLDLIEDQNIHVVTNSINHAALAAGKGLAVSLVGGSFKSLTDAIVGEEALEFLDQYLFDVGFFGVNAITENGKLLTPDMREAAVKRKALQHSRKAYVLADSSKLNQTSNIRFGSLDQAVLITDKDPDNENMLVMEDQTEGKEK